MRTEEGVPVPAPEILTEYVCEHGFSCDACGEFIQPGYRAAGDRRGIFGPRASQWRVYVREGISLRDGYDPMTNWWIGECCIPRVRELLQPQLALEALGKEAHV